MRYRFKGIVRSTGQPVEGHAHGATPEEAFNALSEHGIVTESLREEPESPAPNGAAHPLHSALESALDTASQQVAFDALADKYKGKSVWVIDRDKIRRRVAQVVDNALKEAMSDSKVGMTGMNDVREQVAQAISGLFKDNRNLTSQVSNTSMQMEHQVKRIESMVRRAESVLAQMTVAISKMGSMGFAGGGGVPRRFATAHSQGSEQNAVLLEIFKENLRLRGIEIDEPVASEAPAEGEGEAPAEASAETSTEAQDEFGEEVTAPAEVDGAESPVEQTPLKQWTENL